MGKSTKPFWRENTKCLKLVTGIGAVGRGSLIINDLFVFTDQEVSSIKKNTSYTFRCSYHRKGYPFIYCLAVIKKGNYLYQRVIKE